MWLLTTKGFYSVIQWHDGRMCVRARRADDLDRLREVIPALGATSVSPGKDYRYRAFLTREEWIAGAAAIADTIDYGNFKSAADRELGWKDPLATAYHSIWTTLSRIQPGGPYGFGSRKGYPAVPKKEKKVVASARKADKARYPFTRPLPFGGQSLICTECGHELEPQDAVALDGKTWCRNVTECLTRSELDGGAPAQDALPL